MTSESPEEMAVARFLIPPRLPSAINLDVNALLREGRLTAEVSEQLAKLLTAVQGTVVFDENATCPPQCLGNSGCPLLESCNTNSGPCPSLTHCGTRHDEVEAQTPEG